MPKLDDHHVIEYGMAPIPPVTLAEAVEAMTCPDCVGPVQVDRNSPTPLLRVVHDTTCPRAMEILRRQAAEVAAARKAKEKKKAAKAARKTTKKGKKK